MSKTETNAAAVDTAPAAAPKAPSKMDKAKALFAELRTVTLAEGDSIRKQFISRGQTEIGLTKSGAITYYNNLRGQAKGEKLYPYTKKAAPKAAAPEAQGDANAEQSEEEAQA